MNCSLTTILGALYCLLLLVPVPATAASTLPGLLACLQSHRILNYTTSSSSSFSAVLNFSLQNLRFTGAGVPKPSLIVLPATASEVQNAWQCIRSAQWALRVRNGGHNYEGLSSTAQAPFAIVDLMNMNSIAVNAAQKFAWVEAGVRLGELYYAIASASKNMLGFSAGTCSTIGVSGIIMGGGFGTLSRKYGVAADNVLEAQVITANGTLIKRVSTADPDLFWALRGGGGGAWGIVVAWKLRLVSVPSTVTTFNVLRTGKQAVTNLVFKWQSVAPVAPPEVFISIYMTGISSSGVADMGASFYGQYWGTIDQTVAFFNSKFPELGLTASSCQQGDWIQVNSSSDPYHVLNDLRRLRKIA